MERPDSSQIVRVDRAAEPLDTTKVQSFREIYLAESGYMWNALRRFGVHESDLEDLLHDAFVKVYHSLDNYDAARPLRPWLCGIAFRVASDHRRRARVRHEKLRDALDNEEASAPLPDEQLATEQARALVTSALEAIELDRRAVLVMHDIDGFSVPEIADALSIRLNTAYSRLRLARQDFAAAVRRIQLKRGAA